MPQIEPASDVLLSVTVSPQDDPTDPQVINWTPADHAAALREGWYLDLEAGCIAEDGHTDAFEHVRQRASRGSQMHVRAMVIDAEAALQAWVDRLDVIHDDERLLPRVGLEIRHDCHGFYVCTMAEAEHEDEGNASVGFDGRPHYAEAGWAIHASRGEEGRRLLGEAPVATGEVR